MPIGVALAFGLPHESQDGDEAVEVASSEQAVRVLAHRHDRAEFVVVWELPQ
ncbi:MAG: hypothetical protein ACYCS1_01250 [Gammaproteobacteria bacterium]